MEFLQNWMRDRAIEGRVDDIQNPGEYNASTMDRIGGFFTGVNVDKAVDEYTQKGKNKEVDDYLTSINETRQSLTLDPNATLNQAAGAFKKSSEAKADEKSQKNFERSLAPMQMTMQQSTNQFNQTMQRQLANDAKSHQLQLMQFADNKDQRVAELEYQKSRDRKADMQYNERMETLDRKDRRTAMSSIAAGLASLGAAFAM